MADPMRIRAQVSGDKATVRVLMSHEMETGQRKDSAGKLIPAWFIQEVSVAHNGKTVMTAQWGPAVSKNPFMQCVVRGAKAGDGDATPGSKEKHVCVGGGGRGHGAGTGGASTGMCRRAVERLVA